MFPKQHQGFSNEKLSLINKVRLSDSAHHKYELKTGSMETSERQKLLNQIIWDYNIPAEDIEAVLQGKNKAVQQYNREMIFLKIIESCSWFTIIQMFTPNEIKYLLTSQTISKLTSPSLHRKYEFVQKRSQQIIPVEG